MNESQASSQIVYEFSRAASMEGWWAWALTCSALAALLYLCVRFYRRDVNELTKPVRVLLILLRLVTLLALVFFFFDLQRRTERMVTRPSEVAILVDTSQSMSLPTGTEASSISRIDQARELVTSSGFLDKLSNEHRVSIYVADDADPRLIDTRGNVDADSSSIENKTAVPASSPIGQGIALIAIGILLSVISLIAGAFGRTNAVGWWLMPTMISLVIGIVFLGSIYSIRTEYSLTQILGIQPAQLETPEQESETEEDAGTPMRVVDWNEELAADGTQSRIGDAVRNILTDHDPSTLAGIVLISDGQNNGGADVGRHCGRQTQRSSDLSRWNGKCAAPTNVRVVDIDARRAISG